MLLPNYNEDDILICNIATKNKDVFKEICKEHLTDFSISVTVNHRHKTITVFDNTEKYLKVPYMLDVGSNLTLGLQKDSILHTAIIGLDMDQDILVYYLILTKER